VKELTDKELLNLEIERASAKSRMKELSEDCKLLRKYLTQFEEAYMMWYKRYSSADRELAEHDGRVKYIKEKEKKNATNLAVQLSKEQILEVARALGIEL